MRTCFLALLVGLLLTAGACGQDEDEAPAAPQTTPSATAGAETAERLPRAPGPLPPGTYTTGAFAPTVTFTVGEGWRVFSPDTPTFTTLVHGDGDEPILAFVRPVRVVDPDRRYPKGVPQDALLPVPDDLAGWLASHPRLEASGRKAVTVGGVRGTQVDISVAEPYPSQGCPAPCVLFFATAPGSLVQALEGQTIRATVLDVGGQQIAIGILASTDGFDELAAPAEQVVDTIEFD